jgi:hypothetical protein
MPTHGYAAIREAAMAAFAKSWRNNSIRPAEIAKHGHTDP